MLGITEFKHNGQILGLRCLEPDGKSYGGFQNKLGDGEINEALDWENTKECGKGIHFWIWGMGRDGKEHAGDKLWQVVEPLGEIIELEGKAKSKSVRNVFKGTQAQCMMLLLEGQISYIKQNSSAATSGNRSSASTSGYGSSAATSGERSSASTSGYGSSAATSGERSSAATSGNRSSAATSGCGSSAATSGERSSAATSGERSSASTSGYGSSAATSGERSSAATSGDGSSAATSGERSSASTSGYGSSAATSGERSSAATSGDGSSAATSGERSSAATSGYGSSAATSGYGSSAATSGYGSSALVTGSYGKSECKENSLAVCFGTNGMVKGGLNSNLILSYLENDILKIKTEFVDDVQILKDTWYKLNNSNEFVVV